MAQAAVGRPRYDGTPNHRMAIEVRDETGPVLQAPWLNSVDTSNTRRPLKSC